MGIKTIFNSFFRIGVLFAFFLCNAICVFAQIKPASEELHFKDSATIKPIPDSVSRFGKVDTNSLAKKTDSSASKDSVIVKIGPYQPIPKKAGLYSAILPGLGQVYNHQVWKVPIIYAGLAVAVYFISDNLNNYNSFRKSYIGLLNNPNYTDANAKIYTVGQLQQLQSDYSKYLDESVLYTVVGFGMQILDAISSAHLKNFDISRDISFKVRPVIYPNCYGVGIAMAF